MKLKLLSILIKPFLNDKQKKVMNAKLKQHETTDYVVTAFSKYARSLTDNMGKVHTLVSHISQRESEIIQEKTNTGRTIVTEAASEILFLRKNPKYKHTWEEITKVISAIDSTAYQPNDMRTYLRNKYL